MSQVTLRDRDGESKLFISRVWIAGAVVLLCVAVIVAHLSNLQIRQHEELRTKSRDNRVKLEPLPPTRGLVYDAGGRLLAVNKPTYSLEITPEKVHDLEATIDRLSRLLDISPQDRERFYRLKRQRRRFEGIPIRVSLHDSEVATFAVQRHTFDGVDIHASLMRYYPYGELTAHVLGYVGRINEKELKSIDTSAYSGTSYIGKTGIEKAYEEKLHGKVGLRKVEVNAKGQVLRTLEAEPPGPGHDLRLHLDLELQQAAYQALGEENGVVIALDTRTGGVLAFASTPSFNPNLFVQGITADDYLALRQSPDKPLFNRALYGRYPPGSTIKPLVSLAGLETGVITSKNTTYCPGFFQLPGHSHKYRDWKKWGHGSVDLTSSIAQSCDVYYYELANSLGIERLSGYLGHFGFGKPTGIDLQGESAGLLPTPEWKRQRFNNPWFPGETLILGIGQGYFLTTPLQLAVSFATLANQGRTITPRVVRSIVTPSGATTAAEQPPPRQLPITSPPHWETIIDATAQVVEGERGTARRIRTEAYRIVGKTGTAQVFTVKQDEEYDEAKIEKKMRDHALFVAFAPMEDPAIAVAVIVENGGHGGSVAAPIARRIMDIFLLRNQRS